MPRNIRKHMEKVSDVAVRLGKKLIYKGVDLDLGIVRQAALLHDLAKIITCFDGFNSFEDTVKVEDLEVWNNIKDKYGDLSDPEITALRLREANEEKIANIVRKHHFTAIVEPGNEPSTWEEKLLYYADKLVLHDREVTLKERLQDFDERYSSEEETPANIKEAQIKIYELEQEIKEILN